MIAIPFLAIRVDLLVSGNYLASTVVESIALIALLADSYILIEESALRTHLAADAFDVEEEVLCALETDGAIPLGASEVVIESSE